MFLLADIGGTNARLAVASSSDSHLSDIRSFKNAEFSSLEDVITTYLADHDSAPTKIVIAIAGPVHGNVGRLTNLDWVVDGVALGSAFDGADVVIINDLTALGYAALRLRPDQLLPLGAVVPENTNNRQALVVGIGTGFNVSPIIERHGQSFCPAVEAGHVSLPSKIAQALDEMKSGLSRRFDTVEDLFSGRGRRLFLSQLANEPVPKSSIYIERKGLTENAKFDAALDDYARLIGYLLQDLKLAYLPTGGIFLAGGVARSSLLEERARIFREAFDQPGQFLEARLPVWLINDDAAALTGCLSVCAI